MSNHHSVPCRPALSEPHAFDTEDFLSSQLLLVNRFVNEQAGDMIISVLHHFGPPFDTHEWPGNVLLSRPQMTKQVCRTVVDTANTHPRFPFVVTHAGATAVAPVCVTFIGPTFWSGVRRLDQWNTEDFLSSQLLYLFSSVGLGLLQLSV